MSAERSRSGRVRGRRLARAAGAGLFGITAVLTGLGVTTTASAEGVSTGAVTGFGAATPYGAPAGSQLDGHIVGIAPTPSGDGYWLLGADGGVFAYGDARFHGAAVGSALRSVGIAATPDGGGYWVALDSGLVESFGDAANLDPPKGVFPDAAVVGMAPTHTGMGYWLVGADGGVFSFGNAGFHGSLGGWGLNAPVVGMASTPDGKGYWLVAADGGVFSFGDAGFSGSLGATPPPATTPVVAMASDPGGNGYWVSTTDRAVPRAGGTPSVLDHCNQPTGGAAVRPGSIDLACGDGNAFLSDLTWPFWNATGALGPGIYTHNDCKPDCAHGTFVSVPTTVTLADPVETGAGPEFATVRYTEPDSSVPGGAFTATQIVPTSGG